MLIKDLSKRLWMRIQQRGTLFASNNGQFDKLYQLSDPWQMDSEREQIRFQETNHIIQHQIGRIRTLLEIGCGEGHQTAYLARLCDQLYGFDISKTAVERAHVRCPETILSIADIFTYQPELPKLDLVVACEILYYIKDVPRAITRMNEIGKRCLVTYLQAGPCILDRYFSGIPEVRSTFIQAGTASWRVVWWDATISNNEGIS